MGRLGTVLLLAGVTAACGCERRNPGYCDNQDFFCGKGQRCDVTSNQCLDAMDMAPPQPCADTSACTSPGAPLCDGKSGTCRACLPGEDTLCGARDDTTPRCLSPRCVQCVPPGGPAGPSFQAPECTRLGDVQKGLVPVCDPATYTCRPCRLHAECASGVCQKDALSDAAHGIAQGSCVPAEQVVVVDPSLCSDVGPVFCTPAEALQHVDPAHRYVLIRRSGPQMDFGQIQVGTTATQGLEIYVIGPLSDLPPTTGAPWVAQEILAGAGRGFSIAKRNRVTLEGFFIHGGVTGVDCGGDGATGETRVRVLRSMIADNATGVSTRNGCTLYVEQSWVGQGPAGGYFAKARGNGLALDLNQSDFDLLNTVLANNSMGGLFSGIRVTGGLGPTGTRTSTIVNSTLYGQVGTVTANGNKYTTIACDTPTAGRLLIANSLFFQPADWAFMTRHITPACGAQWARVASDDATLTGNQSVTFAPGDSPGFRDPAALDLHLLPSGGTPAQQQVRTGGGARVDLGGQTILAPAADLDGASRPQGGSVAMGAYEPR